MVKRLKRREIPVPKPVDRDALEAVMARLKGAMNEEDYAVLRAIADADPLVRAELEETRASIADLRKLLKKKQRARGGS